MKNKYKIQNSLDNLGCLTMWVSMAFHLGTQEAKGEYIVLQHNDTEYLFDRYSEKEVIHDAINLLERENYEYITVDKKPPKGNSPYGYDYFADCYWFLCRGDFYSKHNIWVDWKRGDNNHLATITCKDKGLKYLHLPGFFETKEHDKFEFNQKYVYNSKDGNNFLKAFKKDLFWDKITKRYL